MKGYNGWLTRSAFSSEAYRAILLEMEAYQLEFVGRSTAYQNGWLSLQGTNLFSSDYLSVFSRPYEYPYVFSNLPAGGNLKILDVGAGYSFFPFFLRDKNYDVTCLDILDLRHYYADTKIEFVRDDICTFSPAMTYDVVYSLSVIEHLENREAAVKNMIRLLKPGGTLILTFDCDLGQPQTANSPDYSTLASLLTLLLEHFPHQRVSLSLLRDSGLITTGDFLNSRWRLPWRPVTPAKNGRLRRILHTMDSIQDRLTIPDIGVFLSTWKST
jgi:SAM-dependent methyltransferase